jgi:DivIVA domain-containing protein
MPILPEEIATATFTKVHRQGYHPGEVEAFLQSVAADYGAAIEKLLLRPSEPVEIDVGEEVNSILRTAQSSAKALVERAQEEADAIQKAAAQTAQGIESQASEARVRAFEEASNEVRSVKEEAERYAEELRSRTQIDARQMVEAAEQRARELYAYNQALSQHLEEIERLVAALRKELNSPAESWPDRPATQSPDASPHSQIDGERDRMLQDEPV